MRISSFITAPLVLALPTLSNARFIPFSPFDTVSQKLKSRLPSLPSQQILMTDMHQSNIVLPPEGFGSPSSSNSKVNDNKKKNSNNDDDENTSPLLYDVIGRHREISIFSSLTRDVDSAASLLEDSSCNVTILAPLNSAVQQLPRKPWEDEREYNEYGVEEAYAGSAGSARAKNNLERFVLGYVVPRSPWKEREEGKVRTLSNGGEEGKEVWWTKKDGKVYIQPDDVEVVNVTTSVRNGEVWIIRDVLK